MDFFEKEWIILKKSADCQTKNRALIQSKCRYVNVNIIGTLRGTTLLMGDPAHFDPSVNSAVGKL